MKAPEMKKDEPTAPQAEPAGAPKEPSGAAVVSSPQPVKTPPLPKKRENRLRTFLRDLVRLTLFAVIFFVLGAVTFFLLRYQPAAQTADQSQAELEQARLQVSELEGQVESLRTLEDKNTSVEEELNSAKTHILILSAQADILEAQLALANENPADADLALTKTDGKLKSLKEMLPSTQQQKITDLQSRLQLAVSELEKDPFAANSDLEVLLTQLVQLENNLFTQP